MKKWIVSAVIACVVVVLIVWGRTQLKIDSCLDNGGRWNYEQGVCEGIPTK